MKKHYFGIILSVYMLITASPDYAQQIRLNTSLSTPIGALALATPGEWTHSDFNSTSTTSKWLGYWFVADDFAQQIGSTPKAWRSELFDDSMAVVNDNGSYFHVHVHLIANVLQINSDDMKNFYLYDADNLGTYYVDSIEINYLYRRKTSSSVTDTLIAYWWDGADTNNINPRPYLLPPNNNSAGAYPYVDTIHVGLMHYDSTGTNMPKVVGGVLDSMLIPLNVADTNSTVKAFSINHRAVPPGKLFASAFKFKPGYVYHTGDTITNVNDFEFVSDQPNGINTLGPYTAGDYNMSYLINDLIRYNIDPIGYNGIFAPSYSGGPSYQNQQHRITYLVSGIVDVGINEPQTASGLKLFQNQPNPANHTTLMRYEIKGAERITLQVTDLAGRVIMNISEGNQSPGIHTISIDVSKLSKGMYFYTLKTGKESVTKRMIVSE